MEEIPSYLINEGEILSEISISQLFEELRSGEADESRRKLVKSNLRLVAKIAHKFTGSRYSLNDIFQVGVIGLLKAIDNFAPERGVKFSTYAVPVIVGEIKMFLRSDNFFKAGRSLKKKARRIKEKKKELSQELNREPTIRELSEQVDFSPGEIVQAIEADRDPLSLDQPSVEEGITLLDQIADSEEKYSRKIKELALAKGLEELTDRKQKIIKLRFGAGKSQQEVAKSLGFSQAHISRLEKAAICSLRSKLT